MRVEPPAFTPAMNSGSASTLPSTVSKPILPNWVELTFVKVSVDSCEFRPSRELLSWNVVTSGAGFVGCLVADCTLTAKVVVCVAPDAVPVKVMLLLAAEAVESAESVTFCGVPGVTLSDEGEAVTPVGSPETAIEIDPLKELRPAAETVTSDEVPPAWRVTEDGESETEKSGEADEGGDVVEVLDFEPPQEVKRLAQHSRMMIR